MTVHPLTLTERHYSGDIVVLGVSGELDIGTAPQLDDHLMHLDSIGNHRLVLDTPRLTFCDASGVRVLMRARARNARQSGWLRLTATSPCLHRILTILQLRTAFPAFEYVVDAVLADESRRQSPCLDPSGPRASSPLVTEQPSSAGSGER